MGGRRRTTSPTPIGTASRGDRADNLEKAIAAFEAALTVRTREALPREWATTQNNLAIAYRTRVRGDRADNLEKAIAAYEAALTVTTREALPREWATTQNNLAYRLQRPHPRRAGRQPGEGDRRLRGGATVMHARGAAARPSAHRAAAGRALAGSAGVAQGRPGLRERARGVPAAVRPGAQRGRGARSRLREAGPLFAEAAFAAAQRGEARRRWHSPARAGRG